MPDPQFEGITPGKGLMSEADALGTTAGADGLGVSDWLKEPFLASLPVTGVSITVLGGDGTQSTVCVSDTTAGYLEQSQFTLGEGPHWSALRTRLPVLVPDAMYIEAFNWPMFAAAVAETDAQALFSFPMVMGAVTVGVVDMYRTTPGKLSAEEITEARGLAQSVALPALRAAAQSAEDATTSDPGFAPELRREVHQATGMLSVQMGADATDAFVWLRAHAFSSGITVEAAAVEIVARRVVFH